MKGRKVTDEQKEGKGRLGKVRTGKDCVTLPCIWIGKAFFFDNEREKEREKKGEIDMDSV